MEFIRKLTLKGETKKKKKKKFFQQGDPARIQRKKTTRIKHDRRGTVAPFAGSVLSQDANEKEPKKEEEDFIRAVEVGDLPSVRKLLGRHSDLNVNCTDILGRTPLRLAVENEHLEIVELLLDKSDARHLYEALLLSISLDHDEIAEIILKHPIYDKLEKESAMYSSGNFFFTLLHEDSQFSAETTPLILAAQRNRFEIVSFLIRKGQRIEKPHKYTCECPHCRAQVALDELRYARSRLNAFKGLASESYISLSSEDPILTAFELGQELRSVAEKEKHYRFEYEGLARKLSQYVVRLLDHVRGNDELDFILNEGVGDNLDCHGKMARLKLAIKFNEKQFVAHPSCQKKITSIWYGEVQTFQRLPWILRPLFVFLLTLFFPILAIIYWLAPNSKVGAFLRTPFIKFLGQTVSFLIFLTLIVTFSFTERPSGGPVDNAKQYIALDNFNKYFKEFEHNLTGIYRYLNRVQLRQFYPGLTQMLICLWIVGLLWQEIKQLYGEGLQGYLSSIFNFIDFFSLQMYISSFSLRYLSFAKTAFALKYFCQRHAWEALARHDTSATYQAYWLISDRYFWDAWDPINICEGIFSVANVLSFSRLLYLLAANEQLGPLQISLRRMIADIIKFLVIFLIVFTAFLVGLNNLYWYYEPSIRQSVEQHSYHNNTLSTNAEKAFGTIELTFRTVYWALFGMGDPVVVETGMHYQAGFTERVGYIVYGAYNFSAVIVLLNMLIAMMSRSFDTIQNDENCEWKFARAQLYMDYIAEGSTLPPPLNIVPSIKSIFRIVFPFAKCCPKMKAKKHFDTKKRRKVVYQTTLRSTGHEYDSVNHAKKNTSLFQTGANSSPSGLGLRHHMFDISEEEEHHDAFEMTGAPMRTAEDIIRMRQQMVKEKGEKEMTYQSVIKSVLKRYIFESQQDSTSPMEGEIDELKQDLSSFRYEVLNNLNTQKEALEQSINNLSAKLDLFNSLMAGYPDLARSPEGYAGPQYLHPSVSRDRLAMPTEAGGRKGSRPSSETDSVIHGDMYDDVWVRRDGGSLRTSPVNEDLLAGDHKLNYAIDVPVGGEASSRDYPKSYSERSGSSRKSRGREKKFSRTDQDGGAAFSSPVAGGPTRPRGLSSASERDFPGIPTCSSPAGSDSPEKEPRSRSGSQTLPAYTSEDLEQQFVDILENLP